MARERKHITRGLRFTLTAVYTLVFTLLLIGVTLLFRQTLKTSLEQQAHDDLEQNWAVVKGYLRIPNDPGQNNYHAIWNVDNNDPDEVSAVAGVKRTYLITDAAGKVMDDEVSSNFESLGMPTPGEVRSVLQANGAVWSNRTDSDGVPYLIRASYVNGEEDTSKKFYVAVGTSLAANGKVLNGFTLLGVALVPLVILTGCIMGWIFAGRALTPVLEVARTAERISGSNLSLRIPSRGAKDEIDRLIETFNQMIERIEINFNQVRQFSTDVSHELRTPITVVRGQLEVALFTAKTVEQYRDAIVDSLDDIERLSQIVRALLLLSQAETGQVNLQKQQMDLVEVVEDIVDQFQIPAEGAEVTLRFDKRVSHCAGEFDRVQLDRMLSNLLSNAVKFTPAGGNVTVVLDRRDSLAEIRVEDTGPGIPAEHLPHIFDRFYRVRGPGEQASPEKGLGLGLSFVAWIVRAHGGTVDAQSKPGKGTTFIVKLPLSSAAATPAVDGAAAPHEMMKPA
ncbi:MAG TPA: heavy metal sensor histidine kinase [Bryobacteraceae bacterium]|jgi:heavy metal sensor kinase|nr:heavy metal sensor histidine kinase [Bryobacteraceae bacterium]